MDYCMFFSQPVTGVMMMMMIAAAAAIIIIIIIINRTHRFIIIR